MEITAKKLAIAILALALLPHLLLVGNPYTTNVAGAYLLEGLRLYNGQPPAETTHGPLFGILLFFVFKIFGVSIVGAAILVKVLFLSCVMAFFLFINELFGKWSAFFSSLLVLLSRPIYTQLSLHIYLDVLVVALEIWFLFFSARAFKEARSIYFAWSGFFLGLALLAKEHALFLIPFPIAAALLLPGSRSHQGAVRNLLLLYGAFILTITPWLVYLQVRGPSMSAVLGWLTPTKQNIRDWGVVLEGRTLVENLWIYNPISSLWYLFRDRIFGAELLGRFYIVSFVFVFVKLLIVRKWADVLFALALACSLPLAIVTGAFGDRLGHMPEFLFLMPATLPIAVLGLREVARQKEISEGLSGLVEQKGFRMAIGVVFVMGFLMILYVPSRPDAFLNEGFGVSAGRSGFGKEVLGNLETYTSAVTNLRPPFLGGDVRIIAGRHNIELESAGNWLLEHAPSGSLVITDGVYDDPIRFFTRMQFKVVSGLYPRLTTISAFSHLNPYATKVARPDMLEKKGKVVLVTNSGEKFRSKYYRYRAALYLMFESEFLEWERILRQADAYILLNRASKGYIPELEPVLLNGSVFTLVYVKGAIRIFKPFPRNIKNPGDLRIHSTYAMNPQVIDDLKWLRNEYPEEFSLFIDVLEQSKSSEMLQQVRQNVLAG